jgi:hypothetical protein
MDKSETAASGGPAVPRAQVTQDWLRGVLAKGGYDVRVDEKNSDLLRARYEGARPNLTVRLRPGERIVSFMHFWRMKKPGWGQEKDLLSALNKANGASWFSTFARDSDGDLMVSSYLFLTDSMNEDDVLTFVDKEASAFLQVINASGLSQWVE